MSTSDKPKKRSFNLSSDRKEKLKKITGLTDYHKQYNSKLLIKDLIHYFDGEVDFNLTKIQAEIDKPGHIEQLVKKAKQKNTHPVTEFIQELFEDLGQSGDIKWSGEL